MTFPFLTRRDILDMRLLLQVDDYASYDLVARAAHLEQVFGDKLNIKFHYKIFKNTSLRELGKADQESDQARNNQVYIGPDHYFVLELHSSKKNNDLFLETITQICLERADRKMYHSYMKKVQNECFVITLPLYDYNSVDLFSSCASQILAKMFGPDLISLKKVIPRIV